MRRLYLPALLLLFSGCGATHQVVFDPWRGFSKELAGELKSGQLPYAKDEVFKAATDVLDRGPFFEWEFQDLDAKEGLIQASAGGAKTLKLEVVDAGGTSATARSRISLAFSAPKLAGEKKVWMNRNDSLYVTAYDIPFAKRDPWEDLSARFEIDQDYLVSAIYRQLSDQSAVPFALEPLK